MDPSRVACFLVAAHHNGGDLRSGPSKVTGPVFVGPKSRDYCCEENGESALRIQPDIRKGIKLMLPPPVHPWAVQWRGRVAPDFGVEIVYASTEKIASYTYGARYPLREIVCVRPAKDGGTWSNLAKYNSKG